MKRILTIIISGIFLSICHEADAQKADNVYLAPNPKTASWSYIETDQNGIQTATIYNSVESIEGDAVNGNIKILVEEVPVGSPKDTTRSFNFYCFKDGEFMADMCSGFEEQLFDGELESAISKTIKEKYSDLPEEKMKEVIEETKAHFFKISGQTRGIPRYPKVGKLPDYEFSIKISLVSMKVLGEDRRIAGRESIQTPAGSYDCYILEETISIKSMMMKDVEKIRSWYAYGIGLVKEITYDKNGKLVSSMILNEVNW